MRKSRLSKVKQNRLIEHFVAGTTSRTAAVLVGVNKSTASYYFHRLRELIFEAVERSPPFSGEIEVCENHFGKSRSKGDEDSADSIPVFGLLKHDGKVYTMVVDDADAANLAPKIRDRIKPGSVVYTDSLSGQSNLDLACFEHCRMKRRASVGRRRSQASGIGNFWSQAKRHLRRFNGIPKSHFHLYLKECEWRFNNPRPDVQLRLLKEMVANNLV